MFKDILKTLKIKHYVKNLVVLVPLIFSMNLGNFSMLLISLRAVVAFCLASSAVYILNDLTDIENDRNHPIKSHRPIASGKISFNFAGFLFCMLVILSFAISSFNFLCFLMILIYLLLNAAYSFYFKNIQIIDAVCIALGFILRILAGCFVNFLTPSPLVVILTFFLSMFFTFSKRKLEFEIFEDKNSERQSLKLFDKDLLNQFILINAVLSVAFYFTYVLDENTILKAGTPYLYTTVIPFSLIIFRLLFLIGTAKDIDDPISFFENDMQLKMLLIIYFVLLIFLVVV